MRNVLYPGSFDPLTNGHLDLIARASKLFDRVIVAVAINSEKHPMFSIEERVQMIEESCAAYANVRAVPVCGLLVDAVEKYQANAILRGEKGFPRLVSEPQKQVLELLCEACGTVEEGELRRAAEIAQAGKFVESFSEGYDTYIAEKGASLSGGQKQRMSISRALVRKPEILILDDATSALDLSTETRLREALREELKDTTVIMIAQRIASVRHADRIAVIENGTVSACGSHEELMASSETYRDIYASQMKNGGGANE